jgi:hypothetical protein
MMLVTQSCVLLGCGSPYAADAEQLRRAMKDKPSQWPFPHFHAGPGRPRPPYENFYSIDDRTPSYLLCEYPVVEDAYDARNEAIWFKGSLAQIRQVGPKQFPPLKWIAVAIRNRAQHKGTSTFEQSFKVAALFRASDVFDSRVDLSQLVAHAEMDLHPFKWDLSQPTPGGQQRWLIVEKHAASNSR